MTVEVLLWGTRVGGVTQAPGEPFAAFQYEPDFLDSGIQVSPIHMALWSGVYRFPELPLATFKGLPGLLSDSLPDRFGNAIIDAWLARQNRTPESFSILERLCYLGSRGMGALEFKPVQGPRFSRSEQVSIDQLVDLANEVLSQRDAFHTEVVDEHKSEGLRDILRVGTSAGGARAKAVIAWNPQTGEVRSGQIKTEPGFEYWLLKFDGVSGNRDKELADPVGFGAIEYAYSLMAQQAGITMSECRLWEENGRRHFMTKRFDRTDTGDKLHMQSLGGLAHFDFNQAGAYSYEQAFDVIKRLALPIAAKEEQFRRMVFNVVARNQDDHVKNIAFLMDKSGDWHLSPAYGVTYSFNPDGQWTSRHQMQINGKVDAFTLDDLVQCGRLAGLKPSRVREVLNDVLVAAHQWPQIAEAVGIPDRDIQRIGKTFRLHW